jgi:hypothetical protein
MTSSPEGGVAESPALGSNREPQGVLVFSEAARSGAQLLLNAVPDEGSSYLLFERMSDGHIDIEDRARRHPVLGRAGQRVAAVAQRVLSVGPDRKKSPGLVDLPEGRSLCL